MVLNSVLTLIGLLAAYIFFFILAPFWVMGFRIYKGNVVDNMVKAFLVSNIVYISLVYYLAFVGIYNFFTFLLMIALIIAGYVLCISRRKFSNNAHKTLNSFLGMHDGMFSFRIFYQRWKARIRSHLWTDVKRLFKNPVNLVVFMAAMVFAATYRCYHSVVESFFGTSDISVHLNWVRYIETNDIFFHGVYPHGFHNVLSVIKNFTGMNLSVVLRYMGGIVGLFICAFLYYGCRRTFKSAFVANVALIMYCATSFVGGYWRQQFSLPQEYGMMFIYPCGYFLHRFLAYKKKSDLAYFAIGVSLTISAHFYITIVVVLLCIGVFLAHYWEIFKKGVFKSLCVAVILALVSSVGPLMIGRMMGKPWEGSMQWALNVMAGVDSRSQEEIIADLLPEDTGGAAPAEEPAEKETVSRKEYIISEAKNYIRNVSDPTSFYICMAGMALLLVYYFIKVLIFRKKVDNRMALGMALYGLVMCFFFFLPILNLPSLMDFSRYSIFFGYLIPLMAAGPLQLLYDIFHHKNIFLRGVHVALIGVISFYLIKYGRDNDKYFPKPNAFRQQLSSAVEVYYDIVDNYPRNKWTIVSPVDETSMVRSHGFHYELRDFILEMNNYDPERKIIIPTQYVFIYIEKRPLDFGRIIYYPDRGEVSEHVTLDEAHVAITAFGDQALYDPRFFYTGKMSRRILQAKTYYWAQEYIKYFPQEMQLYYEDNEFLVYKITQNPYALNNFSILYEGNNPDVQRYDVEIGEGN